jgi:hypothetical protein
MSCFEACAGSTIGGGCVAIAGSGPQGSATRLVPYFLWADRGRGAMRVFLAEPAKEKVYFD